VLRRFIRLGIFCIDRWGSVGDLPDKKTTFFEWVGKMRYSNASQEFESGTLPAGGFSSNPHIFITPLCGRDIFLEKVLICQGQ